MYSFRGMPPKKSDWWDLLKRIEQYKNNSFNQYT